MLGSRSRAAVEVEVDAAGAAVAPEFGGVCECLRPEVCGGPGRGCGMEAEEEAEFAPAAAAAAAPRKGFFEAAG